MKNSSFLISKLHFVANARARACVRACVRVCKFKIIVKMYFDYSLILLLK